MRPLDRLGLADRAGELVTAPIEVKGLILGPQSARNRARFGQSPDSLGRRDDRHAISVVLPADALQERPGQLAAAGPDPEVQPSSGDHVHRGGHLGQQRGCAEPVACHDHAKPQPLGLRGQRREQRPGLQGGSPYVPAQRHHVVPEPGVLEHSDRVRVPPGPQDLLVADIRLAGLDAEAQPVAITHGRSPDSSSSVRSWPARAAPARPARRRPGLCQGGPACAAPAAARPALRRRPVPGRGGVDSRLAS